MTTSFEIFGIVAIIAGAGSWFLAGIIVGKKQGEKKVNTDVLEANQSAGSYISVVLHHLRTPLSGMMWSLKEMQKNMKEGSEEGERLRKLYDENVRLLSVIEDLLSSSRAASGRILYNFETTNTSNIEQQVLRGLSEMSSSAYVKNISLHIETLPLSNSPIRADQEKIISIIQTLFENSVRYTESGGSIMVRTGEEGGHFVFRISDTGIGIPEKDREKIFTQFFRAENARQKVPDGYGVGLFLAKTFTEAHGGTISYESTDGQGTTFTVSLPLLPS